ncbi:MAG: 4Fe-4S dicluster domain-containing protein [Deltaproteobacteria bacterium]|nr:4Fe-4S dicluster domain-containing protein [Deltaproteobacteria bacterium]
MSLLSEKITLQIDFEKCQRCNSCAQACPSDVFKWEGDEVATYHPGWCIKCGHCVSACPEGAFEHSALSKDRFLPLVDGSPIDEKDLDRFFAERRSCRRFKNEPLFRGEIEELLDKARFAPTATNAQNVRYVVLKEKESIQELAERTASYYLKLEQQLKNPLAWRMIAAAVGKKTVETYKYHMPSIAARFRTTLRGEDRLFYEAPAVVVAFASGIPHLVSAGCNMAAMQILLAAETMGLGACYNGYSLTALIRDKTIREFLEIPEEYHPGAVIAIGHPDGEFFRVPPRRKRRIVWFDD